MWRLTMGELTDKIKGNAKEAVGKAKQHSGDEHTREQGRQQEAEGKINQMEGEVKGKLGDDI